ncbi:MAG: hypothetical protein K0Q53_2206 [Massilibacillus sp.]|jgi:Ni,Fe-hydrogenase III component G|nr:hypothetical protein [Massilibacillus sp.]
MKVMKKIMSVVLFVVSISIAAFSSTVSAAASVTEVDATQNMKAVYEKMLALENYHADIAINIQTSLMNVTVNNSSDIEVNPMRYKNDLQFAMMDTAHRSVKSNISQYMEQVDNQLISYTETDGKWVKQTLPYINKKNVPADDVATCMKLIKKAVVSGETDTEKVMTVTMDNKVLKEMTMDILKQSGKEYKDYIAFTETIFNSLGEISYIINVDKNTNMVTHLKVDLSDATQKSVLAILNQSAIPEKEKAQLKSLFSNAKVTMDCDYSNFNQVSPIEIPQEAKENALEQTANQPIVPSTI